MAEMVCLTIVRDFLAVPPRPHVALQGIEVDRRDHLLVTPVIEPVFAPAILHRAAEMPERTCRHGQHAGLGDADAVLGVDALSHLPMSSRIRAADSL